MLRIVLSLALLAALIDTYGAQASAQERVTAKGAYEISIAGWRIAQATVELQMNGGRYDASVLMLPKGVARIVTAVRTTVSSSGQVRGGRVLPSQYRVRAEEIKRPVAVDMSLRSGNVTSINASPPLSKAATRIAVTNRHKRGIVDPLSSGLIPVRRADGSDACDARLEIFDGWTRYDVTLYFKGREEVATDGFRGTAIKCGARWVPVAGHRPDKPAVQALARNKALELWVVPVPDANIAIPYRIAIGTPNGEILIEPSRLTIDGAGA